MSDTHEKITYKGKHEDEEYEYTFLKVLKGKDFLALREDKSGGVTNYLAKNLEKRLVMWTRPEQIDEATLLELYMDVYNVLYNVALKIEGDELENANSFLAQLWLTPSMEEQLSPSNGSSPAPADGSEPPSSEPEIAETP